MNETTLHRPLIWSELYTVGDSTIDSQHKKLLQLYSELGGIDLEIDRAKLVRCLDELQAYTREHFMEEERLMDDIQYPHIEEHKLMHQEFSKKVNEFGIQSHKIDQKTYDELVEFIQNWISGHILNEDARIGDYLD